MPTSGIYELAKIGKKRIGFENILLGIFSIFAPIKT